jgi:hypothetical protein
MDDHFYIILFKIFGFVLYSFISDSSIKLIVPLMQPAKATAVAIRGLLFEPFASRLEPVYFTRIYQSIISLHS